MNVTIAAQATASTIDPDLHLFDFRADDGVDHFRDEFAMVRTARVLARELSDGTESKKDRRPTLSGSTTSSRTAMLQALQSAFGV